MSRDDGLVRDRDGELVPASQLEAARARRARPTPAPTPAKPPRVPGFAPDGRCHRCAHVHAPGDPCERLVPPPPGWRNRGGGDAA